MSLAIESLAIQPITPAMAALAADLGVALQAGTVVEARVLQILEANLVRIAIANLTLDVQVAKPLQQGQTLQLAVAQSATGLSLTPVENEATAIPRSAAVIVDDIPLAPRGPSSAVPTAALLTPEELQIVAVAAHSAATKQAGLSPLFANLSAALASRALPQPVLIAAAQLLGLRLPIAADFTGGDIKAALQSSGLVMEASLASSPASAPPDLKSALLVLRQALSNWLVETIETSKLPQVAKTAEVATSPQQKNGSMPQAAVVGSLPDEPVSQPALAIDVQVRAVLKALGVAMEGTDPIAAPRGLLAAQLIASVARPPRGEALAQLPASQIVVPPVRGAAPTPQSVAAPTLAPEAAPAIIARELMADTNGALARQTLLQIASLPDRADIQTPRQDQTQPRWNFEIPFVTPQGTAMAQFEIARDGSSSETESAKRIWRARFSLDIEPAGPIHALIAFSGDTTSVKMWAERPETAAQLRTNAFQLTQTLDRAELKTGDIVVADGAPSRGKVAAGHFLNRAT